MAATSRNQIREKERLRVADWLFKKADETKSLLLLAAERGDPDLRLVQEKFAEKTRVLIYVLATFVKQDKLILRAEKESE